MNQDLLEPSDNELGDIKIDKDTPHHIQMRASSDGTGSLYMAE